MIASHGYICFVSTVEQLKQASIVVEGSRPNISEFVAIHNAGLPIKFSGCNFSFGDIILYPKYNSVFTSLVVSIETNKFNENIIVGVTIIPK